MGVVCHRYGISATVPVPIKPTAYLLQVDPHPCFTLCVGTQASTHTPKINTRIHQDLSPRMTQTHKSKHLQVFLRDYQPVPVSYPDSCYALPSKCRNFV